MSAFAAVREAVESAVQAVAEVLHRKDTEQDERLNALESRLTALEKTSGGKAPAASASARTARAKGSAPSSG